MAPVKTTKLAATKPKKTLHSFFGPAATSQDTPQSTPASSLKGSAKRHATAIEISDDERRPTPSNPPVKHVASAKAASLPQPTHVHPPVSAPTPKRKRPALLISSDEDDDAAPPKRSSSPKKPAAAAATANGSSSKTKTRAILSSDEDVAPQPKPKPAPAKKSTTAKSATNGKRRATTDDESASDDEDVKKPPAKRRAPAASTSTSTSKVKAKPKPKAASDDGFIDDDDAEAEKDTKPTKKAAKAAPKPKAPPKNTPKADVDAADKTEEAKPKYNWAAARAAKAAGPAAPGSKVVPPPRTPDCLAGLAFVFTGELSAFSREEAVDLAKRFGGRVTGQPSSKTSFVVLGENAGPSKLRAIEKNGLRTLSEDEFLALIGSRVGPSGSSGGSGGKEVEKLRAKAEKDERAIRDAAKEMERREAGADRGKGKAGAPGAKDPAQQLWTDRYAPQTLKEICGNKSQVEKLQQWLHEWEASVACGFKKPGPSGMGGFRAVLVTGPPGIGKTTSAHMCAQLEGFTPLELNASDARSKKLLENSTNINNTSLDGWMGGGQTTNVTGVAITNRVCLIMDEVDGMSGGDRGGVGALNALIKKTKVPIICIANDRGAQKLKPLLATTFNMTFKRPDANAVRSRILTIAYKEKMKIPANVIDQLVQSSQSDIRQVLNMLSTWKLSHTTMDFDEGKELAKMNEKYTIMTPFNVISKVFGPYTFSPTARETLGEKMEYYFHDHQFMGLFAQENYLKVQPAKIRNLEGPPKVLKQLELMDRAASSISDGDLIDAMIHGPEQHWSLMPLHAVCSFVRPASFLYGNIQTYGGQNSVSFPQWLGQNSKQNKLQRQLGDLQIRMRLKVSGDKPEIRQSYLPSLFPHVVKPLMDEGVSAVDGVIDFMDEYFISRDDWDTLVELGVDEHKDVEVLKKISTAAKTALTKKYNAQEHPIPFHKASDLGKAPKKIAGAGSAPDLEEAFDLDDDVAPEPSDEEKDDSDDIGKDKMIAQKGKKKGKAGASASAGPSGSKSRAKPKPKAK